MVEIDARKFGTHAVAIERAESIGRLTRRFWFHFLSLVSIVAFIGVELFALVLVLQYARGGAPAGLPA